MFSPRLNRRHFAAAALLAAAGAGSPGLRAQGPRPERSQVRIAVPARSGFADLPLTIAQQLGYFRAEGLEVELVLPPTNPRELPAGPAPEVIAGAFEQVVQLQARRQFFRAFVLQARTPQVAMGVSVHLPSSAGGLPDLRGRRIGLATPGSSTSLLARVVLSRAGLRPADVDFVDVDGTDAVLGMITGRLDALSHVEPVLTRLEQRGELRIIGDTRTLKGTEEVFGGPMPASCLYASQEFVSRHPLTCQALANAVVRALKWLQTAGPSDIVKTVPEPYLFGDRALYLAAFGKVRESISPDGQIPAEGVRTAIRVMARLDAAVRPEAIEPARTFTNDFTHKARELLRL